LRLFFFLKKCGIAAFSETAVPISLYRRAKRLFFESSGKKENTQIFLLTAHKYCQDGGFKLKQMS
jgi:hypothetical protein